MKPSTVPSTPKNALQGLVTLFKQNKMRSVIDQGVTLSRRMKSAPLHNLLGASYAATGQIELGIENYQRALEINPALVEAHNNLGKLFVRHARSGEAIEHFRTAVKLRPDLAESYANLASALLKQGDLDAAIETYKECLNILPLNSPEYFTLVDRLIQIFETVIAHNPDLPDIYFNLGRVLEKRLKHADAINAYQQALRLRPNFVEAHNNIASIFQLDEATLALSVEHYDRAIALKPDYFEAISNRSISLLKMGQFKAGWPGNEYRDAALDFKQRNPMLVNMDNWRPKPTDRVLLIAEQGIGDEIMFGTMINELHAQCGSLTVTADARLIPLFKRSLADNITYVDRKLPVNGTGFDGQILFGSLPRLFRQHVSDFQATSHGYLTADPERMQQLKKQINQGQPSQVIGISWRSENANTGHRRTLELESFIKPLMTDGVRFVNLQYGDTKAEIDDVCRRLGVDILDVRCVDTFHDLDGLAALIAACDKVISSANATVHFAGSLGKDVHVLVPKTCDWRWQTKREDSFWYQSVRLYRQQKLGYWDDVLGKIASHIH